MFITSLFVGAVETSALFLSIFVVTLPFTVTAFLGVQLAVPISRFEGLPARDAVTASAERLKGFKRPFGLAFAAVRAPLILFPN